MTINRQIKKLRKEENITGLRKRDDGVHLSVSGQRRGMLSKNYSPPTSGKPVITRDTTLLLSLRAVSL